MLNNSGAKFVLIMKKFLLMIAAVAMMVSCGGGENAGSGSKAEGGGELSFSVQNGISGTTGTKNCFLSELGAPIKFEVADQGENAELTAKVTFKHTDKTEFEEAKEPAKLWISGRQDDNKDIKLTLTADEESMKKLTDWVKAPAGTEVEVVFKGVVPKADMEKLNAKECTNTFVF